MKLSCIIKGLDAARLIVFEHLLVGNKQLSAVPGGRMLK